MISVIIPTFKPEDYLKDCLLSLKSQTLKYSSFEIIIVINGCYQPYQSMIESLISSDLNELNINLFQTNKAGVSNARNIGLDNAKGEYICFIDDDDFVSSNYLSNLFQVVKKNIVVSNVRTYNQGLNQYGDDYISKAFNENKKHKWTSLFSKRTFMSSSWGKIIPTDIINKRRFNLKYRIGEDSLFMTLISDKITNIDLASEDTIYYRRLRNNSASKSNHDRLNRIQNNINLSFEYIKIYLTKPTEYNLIFFFSRIAAAVIKIIRN